MADLQCLNKQRCMQENPAPMDDEPTDPDKDWNNHFSVSVLVITPRRNQRTMQRSPRLRQLLPISSWIVATNRLGVCGKLAQNSRVRGI